MLMIYFNILNVFWEKIKINKLFLNKGMRMFILMQQVNSSVVEKKRKHKDSSKHPWKNEIQR